MCEICLALTPTTHAGPVNRPPAPRPGPPALYAPSGGFTPVAAVCCCVGSLDLCFVFGTKFSLLSVVLSKAVQNSPCMQKKRHIEPFLVSRESFIPRMRRGRVCWESFVPDMRRGRVCWESFVPKGRGVVVVGRIMSCSGVVLVPVGGLWRRPAAHGHCGRAFRVPRRSPGRWRWGFCAMRSPLAACRRRVGALDGAIPPDWRRRSRCSRWCNAQVSDHLGEKR